MITAEKLLSYDKSDLKALSELLNVEDIKQLVEWLNEKDDNIRYYSFLTLQYRAQKYNDIYPYWDEFVEKFSSKNSYQRSLGLMLIAENARWDESGKFDQIVDLYLSFCDDEKPITVRQCIQSLGKIIPYKKHLCKIIEDKLLSINIMERKETQRKILLMDILSILAIIRKYESSDEIEEYINKAMGGGILDKKAKAEIDRLLKE